MDKYNIDIELLNDSENFVKQLYKACDGMQCLSVADPFHDMGEIILDVLYLWLRENNKVDTILDVKVRNNIDEYCVRQVLAYHYLSTKRSDLNIKRLIIYDATSGRSVIININEEDSGHGTE